MKNSISELRKDIVSGDWVVIATGRGRRPTDFAAIRPLQSRSVLKKQKDSCPFEDSVEHAHYVLLKNGEAHQPSQKNVALLRKEWGVEIIPNKYPAFGHGKCAVLSKNGPYVWQDGTGFHDVVVTRSHERSLALLTVPEVASVIYAYRHRYQELKDDACVQYVLIFHNHGAEAGASLAHPHSQIIAIPVVPPDVMRSIEGSRAFHEKEGKCIHCVIVEFELKAKERIVYENDAFLAFAPFASRAAFEVRIFPKAHTPSFESLSGTDITACADVLQNALRKLYIGLNNPPYNFFIHTAPASQTHLFGHYHWHFEILPKTATWAGFELGTGIDISTISPESAAAFLRKIK